ncbi:hypothetical protein B0H12DRAFT_1133015 [Mycena haematopus]|nr:hypothetical protein B0H12DRAFT_1133015 [Mycena haematopus]
MNSDVTRSNRPQRVFLTGQPGIGKSLGACYFLFRLLASGVPVFLVPEFDQLYYFSEAGVFHTSGIYSHKMGDLRVKEVLEESWVLVDVDVDDWLRSAWVIRAKVLVWTSPPRTPRIRRFTNQFHASHWYMKPWNLTEITAVVCVLFSVFDL